MGYIGVYLHSIGMFTLGWTHRLEIVHADLFCSSVIFNLFLLTCALISFQFNVGL